MVRNKKTKKSFILLLIIILFFSLILISVFFKNKKENLINKNLESNTSSISPIKSTNDINQNVSDSGKNTNSDNQSSYQFGEYTISTKDDVKNKTINLILSKNNKETVIDQINYFQSEKQTIKGTFSQFLASSDNKYLHYIAFSGLDFFESRIYDLSNQKIIRIKIPAAEKGFTPDNKYFYGCSEDGMTDGGVIIYQLSSMDIIYEKPNGLMKCKYDSQNNTLSIDYSDGVGVNAVYSFDSQKIIN